MQLKTKIAAGAGLIGLATAALVSVIAAPAFTPAGQVIGYLGQPVSSSLNVLDGKARMFSIDYSAATLGGNLHSFTINAQGVMSTTDNWKGGANGILMEQMKETNGRRIVTISDAAAPAGIPFTWPSLSVAQRALLDKDTASTNSSSPILSYVRGAKDGEGTLYRYRTAALGTIIHSTPVYWKDGFGNETVYVGANDGMMHAIDAVTGRERFAYVPKTLLPKLASLAQISYKPDYFVDGRFDARKIGDKSVLVGTLGGGGKAVYAIDITNGAPADEAAAATKVMWEVNNTTTDYGNLGDTYGTPVLTRLLKAKTAPSDPDVFYDALVMGNGYNNKGNGQASLLVINPLTGALIKEIGTSSGSTSSPNGLSSPSLWDTDGDGINDAAYAGDIDGNMWKFDLNNLTATPVRIHEREDTDEQRAITTAPALAAHPGGGVIVAFVTGRIYTAADMTKTTTHAAYGIHDKVVAGRTLLVQKLTEHTYGSGADYIRVRSVTNEKIDWSKHRGWKVELPGRLSQGGERVVGDGILIKGDVFQFFSTNPSIDPSARPPGENWWMQLSWRNGGSVGEELFDLNNDGKFNNSDTVTDTAGKVHYPVGRHMGGGVRSQLVGVTAGPVDVFQANFDLNDAPKPDSTTITTTAVGGERGVAGGHFDTDIFCYQKCGGSTDPGSYVGGTSAASGQYAYGRMKNTGDAAKQNYIHVHEYDDIYDVLGLNMLHPSQDTQRLAPTVATTAEAYSPNLPKHIQDQTSPSGAAQTVSAGWKSGKNVTQNSLRYTEGVRSAVAGYPQTTVGTDGSVTYTSRVTYTSTRLLTEVSNIQSGNWGSYTWYEKVTRTTWTTTQTTTDTIPNTRFKVLVANQAYSPAVKLSIDGDDGTVAGGTFNGGVTAFQTGAGLKVANLPAYKMNNIKALQFSMPLDAFVVRDWGSGIKRTGLHPIKPQCAGVVSGTTIAGPKGEWRNGALTLQVVSDNVTDADIELNVAGDPSMGYRLKNGSLPTKLIAEYLIYWHHPTNLCMGDKEWTYAAAQDDSPSDAIQGVPAPGSQDPKGSFKPGAGDTPPPPMPTTNPAPVTVKNPDGSTTTTTIKYTELASGGYTTETTTTIHWPNGSGSSGTGIVTGGAVGKGVGSTDSPDPTLPAKPVCDPATDPNKCIGKGLENPNALLGRINWRELQR